MGDPVVSIKNLSKSFRTPIRQRRVDAVKDLTLEVGSGEVFGFLGPNGAGKTTTIRMIMGLIRPTSGTVHLFGKKVPSRKARARLGFLPEAPYFYDYLNVEEFLDLVGRLCGLSAAHRRKRTDELVELVGLEHARKLAMKKFSKGMLQRAGVAQALVNDPDLVVFDEPMSGLDPFGRKEVRDIITRLRDQGKTVFFSSHILADVEMICDRVAILTRGTLHDVGHVRDLVHSAVASTEIAIRVDETADTAAIDTLLKGASIARRVGGEIMFSVPGEAGSGALVAELVSAGAKLISVVPRHETLEDVFIRMADSAAAGEENEA